MALLKRVSRQDADHPGSVEAAFDLDIDVDGRRHGSLAVLLYYLS